MPVIIYDEPCIRCNLCADVCPGDIIAPDRAREKPPVVVYQDECWHCGACVNHCPAPGAIEIVLPDIYKRAPLINKAAFNEDGTIRVLDSLPVVMTRPPQAVSREES